MTGTWKHTLLAAVVMGMVAAGLVWWLEHFEVSRLHAEVSDYLAKYDKFKLWEAENSGDS